VTGNFIGFTLRADITAYQLTSGTVIFL
jgi:hypothetical protein